MKINDISKTEIQDSLTIGDLENYFNVYIDQKKNYVFNLNNSLYLDIDKTSLKEYEVTIDSHWTLISYILYGTTRFAWLLLKLNNIKTKDIFNVVQTGNKILYLDKKYLSTIVEAINTDV